MASSQPAARSRRRGVAFRVAAVLLGLSPLLLLEAGLRLAGVADVDDARDPYVGFADIKPLFELSEDGARFETAIGRQVFFRPVSFEATKPKNGRRIFVLGGSTVQGRPWAVETSLTSWLELTLEAADPSHAWEVVNCGGVSYASYRLVPILEEVLGHEPDLVVVYTGHNEFLEDRTYADIKATPDWFLGAHTQLARWRTYNAARSLYQNVTGQAPEPPPTLPAEVKARLDVPGGLAAYRRDEAWHRDIARHFEDNLRRMVRMTRDAGAPVMFVSPVSNLIDTRPFKSVPSEPSRLVELDALMAQVYATPAAVDRVPMLERAVKVDPRYAAAQYHLGRAYLELGRVDDARRALLRAKEEDVCPLRATEPIRHAVHRVAEEANVPIVDARAFLESVSEHGIVGGRWLVDHVHPTIEGHQRLAGEIFARLRELGLVEPKSGWEQRRDSAFNERRQSLPGDYLQKGRMRLEGLKLWAAGLSRVPAHRSGAPR